MLEEDGVPQVEGGDRSELAEHRRDPPLDAGDPAVARCSTTMAPTGPAVGDHRRDEEVAGVRACGAASNGSRVGVEALHRQQLATLPGALDDPVGRPRWSVGGSARPVDGEDDDSPVGCAEHDATGEAEPRDQAVEDDRAPGGPGRRRRRAGADVDHRLEVGAALAKLALVHRGEDRCREREQPERGDVEDRHPVELDARRPG